MFLRKAKSFLPEDGPYGRAEQARFRPNLQNSWLCGHVLGLSYVSLAHLFGVIFIIILVSNMILRSAGNGAEQKWSKVWKNDMIKDRRKSFFILDWVREADECFFQGNDKITRTGFVLLKQCHRSSGVKDSMDYDLWDFFQVISWTRNFGLCQRKRFRVTPPRSAGISKLWAEIVNINRAETRVYCHSPLVGS